MNFIFTMITTFVVLAVFTLAGCGTEVKQTQNIEGSAELTMRIEIAFPDCAGIVDEELRVRCVEAAANMVVSIAGSLSQDQQAIVDALEIDLDAD